jgi:hypothetical protein
MKAIKTKYLGPTDYRGGRVKADDGDGNSVTIPWDHGKNSNDNHEAAMIALCKRMRWYGKVASGDVFKAGMCHGRVYVWVDWKGFDTACDDITEVK